MEQKRNIMCVANLKTLFPIECVRVFFYFLLAMECAYQHMHTLKDILNLKNWFLNKNLQKKKKEITLSVLTSTQAINCGSPFQLLQHMTHLIEYSNSNAAQESYQLASLKETI